MIERMECDDDYDYDVDDANENDNNNENNNDNGNENDNDNETPMEEGWIMRLNFYLKKLYQYIEPILRWTGWNQKATLQNISEFSEICYWPTTSIRRILFHHAGPEKALLSGDNSVEYFYDQFTPAITLSFYKQINIMCGAFRIYSRHELIVGCMGGMCLWHQCDVEESLHACFISLRDEEDFVTELQWLHGGVHVACALLNARCIQLWQPDTEEMKLNIPMQRADSYLWFLRFRQGVPDLMEYLTIKEEDDDENIINSYDKFVEIEALMKGSGGTLRSACWTSTGTLLFLKRNCSKVFSAVPFAEHGIFIEPSNDWSFDTAFERSVIEANGQRYDCGEPVALAIDTYDVHVAIVFNRQPFVLICLHHAGFGCYNTLEPFRMIDWHPSLELYPTCCTFNVDYTRLISDSEDAENDDDDGDENDAYTDEYLKRRSSSLFIGWTSGYVQEVTVAGRTSREALTIFQKLSDIYAPIL